MKRVVVIASGETEQRALPILLAGLEDEGINSREVRIPPRHGDITAEVAAKIIHALWYERADARPDKIVVLVDTDRKAPEAALADLRRRLPGLLSPDMREAVQYAYTQRHLEAWFFADAEGLKKTVGGSLGRVDTSRPDEIENPKLHLKHLLGSDRLYTSRTSEEVARELNPQVIAGRSPSFGKFLDAVRNGGAAPGGSSGRDPGSGRPTPHG